MEDACHNLELNNDKRAEVEDTSNMPSITENTAVEYKSRSGRVVKRQDYKNINKEDMKLAQLHIKIQDIKEVESMNPKVSPKKFKQEVKSKKNSLKRVVLRTFSKD